MTTWPRDNQADLIAFYGDPGSKTFGANLVKVVPPFAMYFDGKPVKMLSFHRLAAPSLLRALNTIWEYYGRDQTNIDAAHVSMFSGTYNKRMVRGSDTKWSNHAYGAAIDLDAAHNGFNTGHGIMPMAVVAAFKAEGFSWGGDYQHRTDPMHFELCDRGEPVRTFEQWLAHYNVPPRPRPKPKTVPVEVEEPDDNATGAIIQEPPAKSMATSKIGVTQVVAGSTTAVTVGGTVAKSLIESTSETIEAVSTTGDQVSNIVTTTKTVVTAVPQGFWHTVLSVVGSPVFIGCAILIVFASFGLTWYWRRQIRQQGV